MKFFILKLLLRIKGLAIFAFLYLNFCFSNLIAQNLVFNKLNIQEGLSQRSVLCFAQDLQGFIWIGTGSGLNRYDSKTFRIYKNSPASVNSISGNYISSILCDSKNNLWIGTLTGLNKYIPGKDEFVRYVHKKEDKESINNDFIKCIYEDKKGRIWIGTSSGLNIIENSRKVTFSKLFLKNQDFDLSTDEINTIKEDSKGNIWVCSRKYLIRISMNFGEMIFKSFRIVKPTENINNLYTITSIEEDENKEIWIGTKEAGLYKYDELNERFIPFANTNDQNNVLPHNYIRKIKSDGNGKLWLGTQDGLVSIILKTKKLNIYQNEPENSKSISQNSIYDIFFDKDGNSWIGTYYGGVNIVYAKNTPFHVIEAKGEKGKKLSNNVISSIIEYKKNNFLIATEGGGLNYLNRSNEQIQYQKANNGSISSNLIKRIYKDREGNIWVGTHDGGLMLFNKDIKPIRQFINHGSSENQICCNSILDIMEDKTGNIWIGTEGNGLNLYEKKSNHFTHFHPDSIGEFKLNALYIRSLIQDDTQTIWLGAETGLFIKKYNAKGFEKYNHIFADGTKFPNNTDISYIYKDSKKQIWVCTLSEGIYLIKPKEDQLLNFNTKNGIPSNEIKGVIEDKVGNIWITTANGLCKFEEPKKIFTS